MEKLTAERLREVVQYDPDAGVFTRRVRLAQRHQVGDRADKEILTGPMAGYCRIGIDSERYLAHRLAWLYVYGEWPGGLLDHINTVKSDNRIANLRCVTEKLNHENIRKPKKNNKSGFLGVMLHKATGRWRARVCHNRKLVQVGMYDTPEEAHAAYIAVKRRLHEGCTI